MNVSSSDRMIPAGYQFQLGPLSNRSLEALPIDRVRLRTGLL